MLDKRTFPALADASRQEILAGQQTWNSILKLTRNVEPEKITNA